MKYYTMFHTYNNIRTAETQSTILQSLVTSFPLTSEEQTILSRGRNAGSSSKGKKRGPKRLYASNGNGEGAGPGAYQDSTALEALIGYMYLTDETRCSECLAFLANELDQMDDVEGVVR
uniref:RNase III domain-containing protein n=1 Tax=Chaetoceros debilis TaxID=122233 RepID=A0A7S3PWU1_9STRA|mmetsp:Transcript_23294/g.34536  ORF Transcript_23294/g.34536 Transcript_23294/m.34536 type:complete len:119 (+) Transcript_23294:793-1149(+)